MLPAKQIREPFPAHNLLRIGLPPLGEKTQDMELINQ